MSPNPKIRDVSPTSLETKTKSETILKQKNEEDQQISSFPRIWKFPSYRKKYGHNANEWMNAKRQDESLEPGLWRVHDKLYNLEPFIKLHPGGSEWISMTIGTDITEAFETSHVVNADNVQKILAKYYIKDATTPRNSPYTFNENGFYKVLQKRAEPVLKAVGTGPKLSMKILQDGLAFTYFILLILVFRNPASISLQLMTGLILGLTVTCAHNFCHLKDNWRKYYFDLSFLSSYEWRLGHGLSHHLFPNTIMDYEVYLFEPFIQMRNNKEKNWLQKYLSHFYLYILYSQYFGVEFLKRIYFVVLTRKQKFRFENVIPLIQVFLAMYFTRSIVDGFIISFIIHSVASFYLAFVGEAMASHHHPKSFHEGDDVRGDPDFGLCQLDVTKTSVEDIARHGLVAAASFGEHPLHHLFPTVCHSKLHYLQPVVMEVLNEFSEQIQALNAVQKFIGIHWQLGKTNVNKRKSN